MHVNILNGSMQPPQKVVQIQIMSLSWRAQLRMRSIRYTLKVELNLIIQERGAILLPVGLLQCCAWNNTSGLKRKIKILSKHTQVKGIRNVEHKTKNLFHQQKIIIEINTIPCIKWNWYPTQKKVSNLGQEKIRRHQMDEAGGLDLI